eukprot:393422-Amphidinium_carterae.2
MHTLQWSHDSRSLADVLIYLLMSTLVCNTTRIIKVGRYSWTSRQPPDVRLVRRWRIGFGGSEWNEQVLPVKASCAGTQFSSRFFSIIVNPLRIGVVFPSA